MRSAGAFLGEQQEPLADKPESVRKNPGKAGALIRA